MLSKNYQLNYASTKSEMYNRFSREQKARRIVKILKSFLGPEKIKSFTLVDVGSSTGIIDNILAKSFKSVTGIDIDKIAIDFARKNFKKENLIFKVGDALSLNFEDNSVDVVICSHVYEHVPNAKKLFNEIFRILKPQGICYLAAVNKLWPLENHYHLPFLSWLPKQLADFYIRLTGGGQKYYETPSTYWGLKKLTKKFKQIEYTQKILRDPKKFGYDDIIKPGSTRAKIAWFLSPISKFLSPTLFWLLIKKDDNLKRK